MKRLAIAASAVALALLTFFQFPGHTWLQQDTQVYAPVLEHLRDPSVLRHDPLVQQPLVAYTLYDEAALALRGLAGFGFREVLAFEQVLARALGIWGLYLMAQALGLSFGPALLVSAICSLGATIAGPAVLSIEYEPSPRALAVPLLFCAMGLAAHRRTVAAGIAAAGAFLCHPPTALPFLALYLVLIIARRRWWGLAPLLVAAAILLIAARGQAPALFSHLTPLQEQIQRTRSSYVWISTWPAALIVHHLILLAILLAAFARIRREIPLELRVLALGLGILGVASMPVSWLFLEHYRWALVPQIQPMRTLLFVALLVQFLTTAAGVRAVVRRRPFEAFTWFALAYLLPIQPVVTGPFAWNRIAVVLTLAALTALAVWRSPRFAPVVALAAFFAIPTLGGIVNYPDLHTPELAQLSAWARASTPRDTVFLFPDVARGLDPGIFRAEALRAVYVDWKAGGQANYLKQFGDEWWLRWQQTMARRFQPADLPKYEALGISYVVLQPKNRLPQAAVFENAKYVAYAVR
ncbi:MAG: DUF6798 domain-containing protein [Bryobacteraceae bacterium]|jgi:hypothetical protein